MFNRFERRLSDYDRIISQAGTVDVAAMSARYVEVGAKVVVGAAIAETLGIAFDRFVLGGAVSEFIDQQEVKDVIEGLREVPVSEMPPTGTLPPIVESGAAPKLQSEILGNLRSHAEISKAIPAHEVGRIIPETIPAHNIAEAPKPFVVNADTLKPAVGPESMKFATVSSDLTSVKPLSLEQIHETGAKEVAATILNKAEVAGGLKETMDELGRVMAIEKGGSVSAAAEEMVKSGQLTESEFKAAWSNPESVVKIGGENIHISKVGLSYEGNEVKFIPGEGGKAPRFEVVRGTGKAMGTDTDLYNRYGKLGKKPPEWLQKSVLGVTENEAKAMRPDIEKLPAFERVSIDKLPEIKLPGWLAERIEYVKLADTLPEKTASLEALEDYFDDYSLAAQENAVEKALPFNDQLTYLEKHAETLGLTPAQMDFIEMSKEAIEEMREALADSQEAFKEQLEDVGVSYQSYEKAIVGKGLTVKELFDIKKGGSLDEKKWGKFVQWIHELRPTAGEGKMKVDDFLRGLTPDNFHLAKF